MSINIDPQKFADLVVTANPSKVTIQKISLKTV